MTRHIAILALLAASVIPHAVPAQPRPAGPDWGRERHELRRDRREARDDLRDLRRVEALLADYDRASRPIDRRALAQLESEALYLLRQEWDEGQAELARARAEVASDRRDLREERREGDRRGVMEERRDLRDDRRDVAVEARTLERIRQIGDQLSALRNRFRRGDVRRKRELIASMVELARRELRADRRELREDRRELREEHRNR